MACSAATRADLISVAGLVGQPVLNPNGEQRTEIAVDVKAILSGKRKDIPLQSDDILFIPDSAGKKAFSRVVEATIQAAIWRMP